VRRLKIVTVDGDVIVMEDPSDVEIQKIMTRWGRPLPVHMGPHLLMGNEIQDIDIDH
jgi:hypothetical protein